MNVMALALFGAATRTPASALSRGNRPSVFLLSDQWC